MKVLLTAITILFASVASFASGFDIDPKKDSSTLQALKVAPVSYSPLKVEKVAKANYGTAIGIRAIGTSGLSIKHFTGSNKALEGIVGFWPHSFSATLLFEKYANAFDEPGLYWYYGAGGHIASHNRWKTYEQPNRYSGRDGDFGIGVDVVVGMEYKIQQVPIAISLDVKPFLEVTTSGSAFFALDPGLGVKFTF